MELVFPAWLAVHVIIPCMVMLFTCVMHVSYKHSHVVMVSILVNMKQIAIAVR